MIAETASIDVQDNTVHRVNESFDVSVDEAETIAEDIRNAIERRGVDSVLVDNKSASGTWPQEVNVQDSQRLS